VIGLNALTWGGIITIVMLIGFVGVIIAWWFLVNPRSTEEG
jgi:hypothetical protein